MWALSSEEAQVQAAKLLIYWWPVAALFSDAHPIPDAGNINNF